MNPDLSLGRVLGFVLVVVPGWVYILLGACGFWE